jgi:hypothetical protein
LRLVIQPMYLKLYSNNRTVHFLCSTTHLSYTSYVLQLREYPEMRLSQERILLGGTPFSPVEVHRHPSETSVNIYQTTRRYAPEDNTRFVNSWLTFSARMRINVSGSADNNGPLWTLHWYPGWGHSTKLLRVFLITKSLSWKRKDVTSICSHIHRHGAMC